MISSIDFNNWKLLSLIEIIIDLFPNLLINLFEIKLIVSFLLQKSYNDRLEQRSKISL